MTYDDIVRIALALPEVAESTSYGTPSLKRKTKFMLRLKEDGEAVAVKLDWETRDKLLTESPQIYFLTPHYENYPALLARLEFLDEAAAKILIEASWANASMKVSKSPKI